MYTARPEVTGRSVPVEPTARGAFTVAEFCTAHRISRGMLYKMWKAGAGPRWMWVGSKRIISCEAAGDWRRQCEAEAGTGEA